MSYEGYNEYLCPNGHHYFKDVYFNEENCPYCDEKPMYCHQVDQTNGVVDDDPSTQPAPITEIGFEDRWHTDHYGTRYATKMLRYTPALIGPDGWRKT